MLSYTFIAIVAALLTWLELPRMRREKEHREIWGFSAFMLLAVGISVAQTISKEIPTPLVLMTAVFKPFSDLLTAVGLIR